jgi:hypothetical protein
VLDGDDLAAVSGQSVAEPASKVMNPDSEKPPAADTGGFRFVQRLA